MIPLSSPEREEVLPEVEADAEAETLTQPEENLEILIKQVFYLLKPLISRWLQLTLRRRVIL